jgi:hypothetical protein
MRGLNQEVRSPNGRQKRKRKKKKRKVPERSPEKESCPPKERKKVREGRKSYARSN